MSMFCHLSIEAVVFPGGFGAAKNLSDFGFKGADMQVDADVQKVIQVRLVV